MVAVSGKKLLALAALFAAAVPVQAACIDKEVYGTTENGEKVFAYTLVNNNKAQMQVLTYGATVSQLRIPDKNGKLGDVLLGFDNLRQFETQSPYFGCIVGRVGNRIANGVFQLDGSTYFVPVNNGPNHLHGGFRGLDKRVWAADSVITPDGPSVRLSLTDADGTEGYPGTVKIEVIYTLTGDNGLKIQYHAVTDRATPLNLTNHCYFNLKDAGATSILDHQMKVYGSAYTPVNDVLIPTGQIAPVAGTPIDFQSPKAIGQDLKAMGGNPAGYDHNLVLAGQSGKLTKAVEVYEPTSGRLMEVWTTEPGVQFYSGNFLDGSIKGRDGNRYGQYHGFCLETQHYPDSINQPTFPKAVLRPGEVYRQVTEYRFTVPAKAPW